MTPYGAAKSVPVSTARTPGSARAARRVDAADDAVRDGAAQDASHQRLAERQVGGVAGAAGHLLDAVDERRALADGTLARRGQRRCCKRTAFGVHLHSSTAACTDSTILT